MHDDCVHDDKGSSLILDFMRSLQQRAQDAAKAAEKGAREILGVQVHCVYEGERQNPNDLMDPSQFQPHAFYWSTAGSGQETKTCVCFKWSVLVARQGWKSHIVEGRLDVVAERGIALPRHWRSCVGLEEKLREEADRASVTRVFAW